MNEPVLPTSKTKCTCVPWFVCLGWSHSPLLALVTFSVACCSISVWEEILSFRERYDTNLFTFEDPAFENA